MAESTGGKTEVALPSYLQQYQNTGSGETDSLASASISIPRISLRGRQFRFIEGGEEIEKRNDFIDVIVLGVDPEPGKFVKTYYASGYTSGSSEPPTCASDDGIRPSAWISEPQNDLCASCPQNRFGSATSRTGKPSKACRDSKRLWVVRADDPKGVEGTVYGLNITVMSLKALSEYGRKLKVHNVPLHFAITRFTMVDSEFPQLSFDCVGFVKEEEVQTVLQVTEKKAWKLFTSAGLALAAPDQAPMSSLPGLPAGGIPAHVQQAAPNTNPPIEGQATKAADSKPGDVLSEW